jgi:steroid delta-isomerase-like uncharacterized protein
MSIEENVALVVRAVEEAYNKSNVSVYDETLTDDYIAHDPGQDGEISGRDAAKERALAFHRASPNMRVTLEDIIADDEHVVTRWRFEGTHDGPFRHLMPTGRAVTITGVTIDRFVDGRVAETWHYWDMADLTAQLQSA